MKISSRSILSPARAGAARDPPPISLSKSHSRRLRNSRSIKGGASPAMFPATGKKRGSGFENPEPSSPKVTCIGQVRVKSKKKHAKNLRSLSRRRSAGEVSFRRLEHSGSGFGSQSQNLGSNYQQGGSQECLPLQRNNQRWVHLPLTICEALRTLGSEVSCLFPCRSSCSSTTAMVKEEKMGGGSVEEGNRQGSCAVFARWLVALQEGEGGRRDAGGGREIQLVAGDDGDENNEIDEMAIGNPRRHVFQDLEIVNGSVLGTKDEARVSTCVPPKNALLLMRCRSDPMKMEALTNRFWEPNMEKNEEQDEDEDKESVHDEEKIEQSGILENLQLQEEETHMASIEVSDQELDDLQENEVDQEEFETISEMETKQRVQEEKVETNPEMETKQSVEEEDNQEQSIETNEEEEEESMFLWSLFEENPDQDQEPEEENEEEEEAHSEMEDAQEEFFEDVQVTEACESNVEKVKDFEEENAKIDSSKSLPECLLLMMYEPKLSMEVSKETWVCSADFIRHHSRRKPPPVPPPVKSTDGQDESKATRMAGVECQPVLQQPARSSCSFPATSMATMFDQKLANTNGFEPLVLKRSRSEPHRAKIAPDSGFWKNKLEPPRRASFGIDVAGFGF
ncbi:hypothetical protein L1887_25334 [Cichorium endivia]|nr:hypothetical protein L1887_25334 [Cichorium endivia]